MKIGVKGLTMKTLTGINRRTNTNLWLGNGNLLSPKGLVLLG